MSKRHNKKKNKAGKCTSGVDKKGEEITVYWQNPLRVRLFHFSDCGGEAADVLVWLQFDLELREEVFREFSSRIGS